MSKQEIVIEASERSGTGKGYARKLRRAGKIPGVLLLKGEGKPIELDPKLLPKVWKNESREFTLKLGSETKQATITDLQIDPVKRLALHVDLKYV